MFKYGLDKLTVSKVLSILKGQETAGLCKESEINIKKSHEIVLNVAQKEKAVYGINTGFGPLCDTKISKENTSKLQRNILLSHSVGVGDPIDKELSKLMMILKY